MAVRALVEVFTGIGGLKLYKWEGLLNGDTGTPVQLPNFSDKSLQAIGTFGAGGTVTIQGSNDQGTTFGALHRFDATDLTLTDSEPGAPVENTLQIRPNVTAGDGTTSLAVWLLAHTTR